MVTNTGRTVQNAHTVSVMRRLRRVTLEYIDGWSFRITFPDVAELNRFVQEQVAPAYDKVRGYGCIERWTRC